MIRTNDKTFVRIKHFLIPAQYNYPLFLLLTESLITKNEYDLFKLNKRTLPFCSNKENNRKNEMIKREWVRMSNT